MSVKRYVQLILAVFIATCFVTTALGADTYVVDTSHATVGFTVKHLVLSKVRGNFNEFSGTITYDENDITKSSLQGTIKTASINTDNEKRDKHLRSPDFFDAANHPEITFESSGIGKHGSGHVLYGTLTMRGVSKAVAIPFVITGQITHGGKTRIGFEAQLKINRQEYGIAYSKTMDSGGLIVGNSIHIEIVGEAIKQG